MLRPVRRCALSEAYDLFPPLATFRFPQPFGFRDFLHFCHAPAILLRDLSPFSVAMSRFRLRCRIMAGVGGPAIPVFLSRMEICDGSVLFGRLADGSAANHSPRPSGYFSPTCPPGLIPPRPSIRSCCGPPPPSPCGFPRDFLFYCFLGVRANFTPLRSACSPTCCSVRCTFAISSPTGWAQWPYECFDIAGRYVSNFAG